MGRRRKRFNWALYESLRQVEREEAFRLLKWAVDSLPPPWDSGWKGVGHKPYDARALTAATIWREIEGKPERAYTANLEKDKERLNMLGLEHAPKLSEGCMEKLNRKRGLSLLGGWVRTLWGCASPSETAPGLQPAKMAEGNTSRSAAYSTLKQEPLRLSR